MLIKIQVGRLWDIKKGQFTPLSPLAELLQPRNDVLFLVLNLP